MKELALYYIQLSISDSQVLALFPTNDEVAEFNNFVCKNLNLKTIIVDAEDSEIRLKRRNNKTFKRPCNFFLKLISCNLNLFAKN